MSKMAINGSDSKFRYFGQSMKNYAFALIFIIILNFIVAFTLGNTYATSFHSIYNIYYYIERIKKILIIEMVMSLILYLFYGILLLELFKGSKNNPHYSVILRTAFIILLIGFIAKIFSDFMVVVLQYKVLNNLQSILSSFRYDTETDFTQINNQINHYVNITNYINLVPVTFLLLGFILFERFGKKLKLNNRKNPNSKKIHNGLKLLLLGSVLYLFGVIMSLNFKDFPISLFYTAYSILTIIGMYKAGNGLILFSKMAHRYYESPALYNSQNLLDENLQGVKNNVPNQ